MCKETIESFFAHFYEGIIFRIEETLGLHNSIKIHCSLSLKMQKFTTGGCILYEDVSLKTTAEELYIGTNLQQWVASLVINMLIRASFTVLTWRLKSRIVFVKPPKSVT